MKCLFAAVLLVLFAVGSSAGTSRLRLLHAAVIDVRTGVMQLDMTVIVIASRISKVIPTSQFHHSLKDRVIDASGKFVIPGLRDMHVHLVRGSNVAQVRSRTLPLLIANGVTAVRDMGGDLQPLKQPKREIETGKLLGPRMVFSGPMIDGPNPPYPSSISIHTANEARDAVDSLKTQGANFIKVQSRLSRDHTWLWLESAENRGSFLRVMCRIPSHRRTLRRLGRPVKSVCSELCWPAQQGKRNYAGIQRISRGILLETRTKRTHSLRPFAARR